MSDADPMPDEAVPDQPPPPRRPWWRWRRAPGLAVAAEVLLIGLVGGWLGVLVGGQMETTIGPLQARLSVVVAPTGDSVLSVPPLGHLSLDTHDGPFRLDAEVTQINESDARAIFNDPTQLSDLPKTVSSDLSGAVRVLVVRSVLSAIAGALLLGLLVFRRRLRRTAIAAAVSLAVAVMGGATAAATWNPKAINEPTYDGLLASAPTMVGDARDIVTDFRKYERQLAKIVTNVSRLYDVTSTLPAFSPSSSTIRVLFVSDMHLNPASWGVIQSVTKQFDVNAVVDTGDISDHGLAAENAYLDPISTLKVPYVWVRGNHDSQVTQQGVAAQPNAVVLDGNVKIVAGLKFAGIGDPRFTPDKDTRDQAAPVSVKQTGLGLGDVIRAQPADAPVDVAMMHDPEGGAEVDGLVPLVLDGHLHRRSQEQLPGGTLQFVQGSTGGSGLRALEGEKPTPVEASVLYFDRATHALQAWDDISLGGLGLASASIKRHVRPDAVAGVTPGIAPSVEPPIGSTSGPSVGPEP
jgi:predicted phosphodiesterase